MPPRLISSTKERSKRIGLMQVMLNWNPFHELAPFSSNKNQVKILDLGFGGALRIFSAAITRLILLPAEVRESREGFHSGIG